MKENFNDAYDHAFSVRNDGNKLNLTQTSKTSWYSNAIADIGVSPAWGLTVNYQLHNYNVHTLRALNPNFNVTAKSAQRPKTNPFDWSPRYQRFNPAAYFNLLNNNLNTVKILAECSSVMCAILVQEFDYTGNDSTERAFVDIILRDYNLFKTGALSRKQKRCLVKNIYYPSTVSNTSYNATQHNSSETVYSTCNVSSPLSSFPLKDSCRRQFQQYWNLNGLPSFLERFKPNKNGLNCTLDAICPGITNTSARADQLNCGASLGGKLFGNGLTINYQALILPCNNLSAPLNATNQTLVFTSYLQKHSIMKKLPLNKIISLVETVQTPSSGYVNTASLSASDKAELSSAQNSSSNQSVTANIDGSTPNSTANNTSADISAINSQASVNSGQPPKGSSNLIKLSIILIGIVVSLILF